MAKKKRRGSPSARRGELTLVRAQQDLSARTSSDIPMRGGSDILPPAYHIEKGTVGILVDKSAMPELRIVEFEHEENSTCRVEVYPEDIEVI